MDDRIRIIHVLPDLAVGGGQVLLLRNLKAASAEFEHHVVYVRPKRDMLERFEAAGATCHFCPSEGAAGFLRAGHSIRALATKVQAHVIHTNNTGLDRRPGLLAAWKSGLPLVNTLHAEGPGEPRPKALARRLKEAPRTVVGGFESFMAHRALSRVIAVSRHVRDSWMHSLRELGIGPDRVRVIHPGLDLREFDEAASTHSREAMRRALRIPDGAPALVHVGRLTKGKGHEDAIRAMVTILAKFPDAVLVFVGDGPDREKLEGEARATQLGDAVRFLGDRSDVPAVLKACEMMVFPSHSEGFGLAPLEGMAAGLPVVSYRLPSVEEFLVEGQSGLFVPVGNSSALGEVVVAVLSDRARRETLGRQGRAIVEAGFGVERCAREHETVYREMIEEHRRRKGSSA